MKYGTCSFNQDKCVTICWERAVYLVYLCVFRELLSINAYTSSPFGIRARYEIVSVSDNCLSFACLSHVSVF